MKRIVSIIIGVIAVLVGLGFIMPAIAQWRTLGSLPGLSVALLMLGVLLTVGGGSAAVCGIRKPKA
jgi:hypothetical protein